MGYPTDQDFEAARRQRDPPSKMKCGAFFLDSANGETDYCQYESATHPGDHQGRAHVWPRADVRAEELKFDPVNRPKHYATLFPEPITVIENWNLGFHLGQVIKYVSRAGRKDESKTVEDLEKARWYLDRAIANLKKESR
jgi:hypothetical protein